MNQVTYQAEDMAAPISIGEAETFTAAMALVNDYISNYQQQNVNGCYLWQSNQPDGGTISITTKILGGR